MDMVDLGGKSRDNVAHASSSRVVMSEEREPYIFLVIVEFKIYSSKCKVTRLEALRLDAREHPLEEQYIPLRKSVSISFPRSDPKKRRDPSILTDSH
jgi:hypothetical protein